MGRSGPLVEMTCCLPGHHWLLPQRNRRNWKPLLRPTHSTLIGVSSGWVGLRLLACLLPPPAPIPAAPIPATPIPAADAPPVRVKPALTEALRSCEQRGKPQCCQPTSKSSVATVVLRCTAVYIYYIMIEL